MRLLLDSAWRAAAYCLLPRVIFLSLLPLLIMVVLTGLLQYFFWASAVAAVNHFLMSISWLDSAVVWIENLGLTGLHATLAPLVVVFISTPVIVLVALLIVATMMTPAVLALVRDRRFPQLERKRGGSMTGSLFGATWTTIAALVAFILTMPLWFIPPLVLIIPPLIWGWLTYRVMSYDVLAEHASREERQQLISRHRTWLLVIGVITGYLGAAPSLIWATGLLGLALAFVLVPLAIWIYTLVFAFSALWFAHYALAALEALRAGQRVPPPPSGMIIDVAATPAPPLLSSTGKLP
jgi:hypothetical protein